MFCYFINIILVDVRKLDIVVFTLPEQLLYLTPVHKIKNKQLILNYRPISLLPIFGKIFEKVALNRTYHFLLNEGLLNSNQSGFRPSDSCINQLLAITDEFLII